MKADTVGQPVRQRLEDQRGVEARHARNRRRRPDIDAADAEARGLAHHIDGEMLFLIPAERMRRDLLRGEFPRHVANRHLVLVESETGIFRASPAMTRGQFIVGIENSAPSLTPDGQREVIVLVLV